MILLHCNIDKASQRQDDSWPQRAGPAPASWTRQEIAPILGQRHPGHADFRLPGLEGETIRKIAFFCFNYLLDNKKSAAGSAICLPEQ
jgi:hypothetical protein